MAERHDDEADHVFDGELLPETPALERVSEKRRRTGAVSALLAPRDHTRDLAHAVFMDVFARLPTRQWPELGLVSRHWRRMQLSFFAQHNNIVVSELGRERPTSEREWQQVAVAVEAVVRDKTLKPEYRQQLQARPGGCEQLHVLLVNDALLVPLFARMTVLRHVDLSMCERVTDVSLLALGDHHQLVERVVLTRCLSITGIGVAHLLESLPRLRELNVGWCPLVDDEMIDLDYAGHRELGLQSVQLSWTNVSLSGVFTLISQCRELKQLAYGYGRSPLFDSFLASRPERVADPPQHVDCDEYVTAHTTRVTLEPPRADDWSWPMRDDEDAAMAAAATAANRTPDTTHSSPPSSPRSASPDLLPSSPAPSPLTAAFGGRCGGGGRLDGARLQVPLHTPVFAGCLPCRSPFCSRVENAPFEYGVCAGCKSAMYCSKACQGVAWHFGHGSVCRLQRSRNGDQQRFVPFREHVARGMAKSTALRLLDASGNRPLADIVLGAMLVHQERYERALREQAASSATDSDANGAGGELLHYVSDVDSDLDDDVPGGRYGATEPYDDYPVRSNGTRLATGQTSRRYLLQVKAKQRASDVKRQRRRASLRSALADVPRSMRLHIRSDLVHLGHESFFFAHTVQRQRWLASLPARPRKPVQLHTACLSKCMISDERLRALRPLLGSLHQLDLEKSCATDVGISLLATSATALRDLQLTGARLTLETAPLLCASPTLRTSLVSLLIGGTSAMSLQGAYLVSRRLESLQRLYVWSQISESQRDRLNAELAMLRDRPLRVYAKPRTSDVEQ